jgi:hypothetical protein
LRTGITFWRNSVYSCTNAQELIFRELKRGKSLALKGAIREPHFFLGIGIKLEDLNFENGFILASYRPSAKKIRRSSMSNEISDRYYNRYVPFKEIINLSLDSRGRESNIPLINLFQRVLDIDIQSISQNQLESLTQRCCQQEDDSELKLIFEQIFPDKDFEADFQVDHGISLSVKEKKKLIKKILKNQIEKNSNSHQILWTELQSIESGSKVPTLPDLERMTRDGGSRISLEDLKVILCQNMVIESLDPSSVPKPEDLPPYKNSNELLDDLLPRVATDQGRLQITKDVTHKYNRSQKRQLDYHFNFLNDEFGELIVNAYCADSDRKSQLSDTLFKWTNQEVADGICQSLLVDKGGNRSNKSFYHKLMDLINNLDKDFCSNKLEHLLKHSFCQNKNFMEKLSSELLTHSDTFARPPILNLKEVKEQSRLIRSKINRKCIEVVKKEMFHEINQYDGLIEHFVPATVRGIHDVSIDVIKKLTTEGDYSSAYDLFKHEVSSRARASKYARGHSGSSNRSTTLSNKIATYFATMHGMRGDAPESLWMTIYESQEGLYMSEIEPQGDWKEAEVVTPYLSAQKCLGAVEFKVDHELTTSKNISLKAHDGFLTERGKSGSFEKHGLVEDIKLLFDLAIDFHKAHESENLEELRQQIGGLKPFGIFHFPRRDDREVINGELGADFFGPMTPDQASKQKTVLSDYKKRVSAYDSDFLDKVVPKPLSEGNFRYRLERTKQRAFAKIESFERAKMRLLKEADDLKIATLGLKGKHTIYCKHPITAQMIDDLQTRASLSPEMVAIEQNLLVANQRHYRTPFPSIEKRQVKTTPYFSRKIGSDFNQYMDLVQETGVSRAKHGTAHASRTTLWVTMLANLANKKGASLSPEAIKRSACSASFHDAAREDEGVDHWDDQSADLLTAFLEESEVDPESINKMSEAVRCKDKLLKFDRGSCEQSLLHDADTLEIMRMHRNRLFRRKSEGGFNLSELLLFKHLEGAGRLPKEKAMELLREVQEFIDITEHAEIKRTIERSEEPIRLLLGIIDYYNAKFPRLYTLLRNGIL